ncbi:ATP-binding response regulator [Halohasta litorea]|uniref:histidine kinase n=1 Tax=Halohasta litorea TaxID=869891 RepID=A0ABD6D766_9EURY|nr:ATP-binding protein [Halohasta litorea]
MSLTADDGVRLLLIEDNPGDAKLFEHHLTTSRSESFPPATVSHVRSLDEGIEALETDDYDLVLLDLGLPGSSGLETLDRYNEAIESGDHRPVPVIVLTGLKDDAAAVEAIERGAQDYLVKDNVDENVLHRTIRYGLERHHQQEELRRQNERLEQFANVVSHDLRNPLNVAKGRIEMVDSDHAAVIERNLDRMGTIIDDVLTLAREGKSVEETEPVDLATLVTQCWDSVETADASLSTAEEITVMADPSRCRQLLENLIRNSIEHVGETVSIHLGTLDGGFYFEDDGPGIPEAERGEIFEAGYTTNEDGTGFGLNIVREIAEAHGWAVEITDGTEGGARFEFTGVTPGVSS